MEREKEREINGLKGQLGRVNQQLEESEQVIAQFQEQIAELEQLRPDTDTSSSSKEQRASIKLTWIEGGKAPCGMSKLYCAAADGKTLHVRLTGTCVLFSYIISTSSWSRLSDSPTIRCPLVIVNNLLTLVGGYYRAGHTLTNRLLSLTGKGSSLRWAEIFPPMPTTREGSTALCTGTALIVAGGEDRDTSFAPLRTVEVMSTESLQWSTAANLPQAMCQIPATVCGSQMYIMGENNLNMNMYTCSLQALIKSQRSFLANLFNRADTRIWKKVAAPPVTETTCVSIYGRLLAIGGKDLNGEPTTAIHMYNPTADSWEVISHMGTPRWQCIAAVLPNNQLMVAGGHTADGETDSVEFAIE